MTNKKLPSFLLEVKDADGNLMGHVSYHGLYGNADEAIQAAFTHFVANGGRFGRGLPKVRSLPIENLTVAKSPSSLDEVKIDVLYANDCCALTLAELPLASHVQDAEVTCQYCHSTFRFVPGVDDNSPVWRWRVPRGRSRRDEIVRSLGEVVFQIRKTNAQSDEYNDEAREREDDQLQQSTTRGLWGKDGRPDGPDCG